MVWVPPAILYGVYQTLIDVLIVHILRTLRSTALHRWPRKAVAVFREDSMVVIQLQGFLKALPQSL